MSQNNLDKIKYIRNYYYEFEKFIDLVPVVEQALECLQWIKKKEKLEELIHYDLNDVYTHLGELIKAIDETEVSKNFGKYNYIDEIICFIYSSIMVFSKTNKVKRTPVSEKFIEGLKHTFITPIFLVKFQVIQIAIATSK